CPIYGDQDLPDPSYVGQPKLFYKMDSVDIGPMVDGQGNIQYDATGNPKYELHYSPNWTHELYNAAQGCDVDGQGNPLTTQLKYKNPPTERTIICYVTQHVATAGSNNCIILLLSGTARKVSTQQAYQQLPLGYQ
ncbi:MAG TPA: hypothetical protein VGS41_14815, partial [Chthonomonadales bacterium]|nr:hypothetical protein [Chthonomonadales bacterium]